MDNLNTIKKIKFNNMLLIGSTGYLGAHVLDAFYNLIKVLHIAW